jgi:O-antigen ligase
VDVSVDETRAGLQSWLPRRFRLARTAATAKSLDARSIAYAVPRWELVVAVVVLFVMGRLPLLFFRLRSGDLLWPIKPLWQDDLIVLCVLGAAQLAVIAIAIRRAHPSELLKQPLLIAFLAFAWLSIIWSVEPAVSMHRSLLMVGAAGVGWYIGDRFTLRNQVRLLSWLGWTAAATTVVALFTWNRLARATNNHLGEWSGIYVNRNSLALVLSVGLLGSMFFLRTARHRRFVRYAIWLQAILLFLTRSKTGVIGLGVAFAVALVVHWLRKQRSTSLRPLAAAYVVFATFATTGLFVHWYWADIIKRLNRNTDLTGRTTIWQLVRWFGHLHPWRGWGFEAIWTNTRAIGQAQAANGQFNLKGIPGGWPYAAHNGYYEIQVGLGYLGLALLVLFLGHASWRAFQFAWNRRSVESLWPLAFLAFAMVVNFSESLFVSSEAVWALTVAAAVAATRTTRPDDGDRPLEVDLA